MVVGPFPGSLSISHGPGPLPACMHDTAESLPPDQQTLVKQTFTPSPPGPPFVPSNPPRWPLSPAPRGSHVPISLSRAACSQPLAAALAPIADPILPTTMSTLTALGVFPRAHGGGKLPFLFSQLKLQTSQEERGRGRRTTLTRVLQLLLQSL